MNCPKCGILLKARRTTPDQWWYMCDDPECPFVAVNMASSEILTDIGDGCTASDHLRRLADNWGKGIV